MQVSLSERSRLHQARLVSNLQGNGPEIFDVYASQKFKEHDKVQ